MINKSRAKREAIYLRNENGGIKELQVLAVQLSEIRQFSRFACSLAGGKI